MESRKSRILLYGLQRSGTNFLEQILLKNFAVKLVNSNEFRDAPTQKHFRLFEDKSLITPNDYRNDYVFEDFSAFENILPEKADGYIVISKDPYSWTLSYGSWAAKCNWRKVDFPFAAEWEAFYCKWLEFGRQSDKIVFIRYVDLLGESGAVLAGLAGPLGLEFRSEGQDITYHMERVPQSGAFTDERKQYYIEEKYLAALTPTELERINSVVSDNTLSSLSYRRQASCDRAPKADRIPRHHQ